MNKFSFGKKITRKLSSSANASFCSAFSLHNFKFTVGEALEWNLFSSPDKILGDIRLRPLVQVVSPVRGNVPASTASHQEPDSLTVECYIQQDVPSHLPRDAQVSVHVLGNRPVIGKRRLLARVSVSCWEHFVRDNGSPIRFAWSSFHWFNHLSYMYFDINERFKDVLFSCHLTSKVYLYM